MKAVLKEVGKKPQVIEIENTLQAMQKAVGGYIQVVSVGAGVVMICDEEGKLKNKPLNFGTQNDVIVGDVLFLQDGGKGDFADLSEENTALVIGMFEVNAE